MLLQPTRIRICTNHDENIVAANVPCSTRETSLTVTGSRRSSPDDELDLGVNVELIREDEQTRCTR